MKRILPLILFPLLLTGSKCRPDKEITEPPDPLPTPQATLQVASIEPAFGKADQSFAAEVYGSGFSNGAEVWLGNTRANGVQRMDEATLLLTVPAMPVGSYDVIVVNPDGTRSTLRKGLTLTTGVTTNQGCSPATVYFDFDSSTLSATGRATVDQMADCLRSSTGEIRVDGHCDERGTTEYNLALGQRRADAVQRYLLSLGISPTRIRAVSYGEEKPAVSGSGESAWSKNRRAEIQAR